MLPASLEIQHLTTGMKQRSVADASVRSIWLELGNADPNVSPI